MSSMILYHGEPNGPSLAVLAALGESGLNAECVSIDLLSGARHSLPGISEGVARDMGVEGEGPVLVVADENGSGEAMTESVFIAQYLDECGNGSLQPKDAYAHWQMLMWCRRITERCAPAAAFLGCKANARPSLDDAALSAIVSEDLRARWNAVQSGDYPEAQVTDSIRHVTQAAELVEEQLSDGRDWLMGDLTIADFETYGWLAAMADLVPEAFEAKTRLASWLDRVKARPSVANALALATLGEPRKSWAPGPEINRWG
jgi:GSH-dependent disulfide-bond oxidoreductase